ncbi:hypothetical protein BKA63DRAFT_487523 [Paraphoma chrysanthemicola]|nr:hypothetical protein BKA63DRAFT_487523 [Paraphoma chrysanthemicola]
MTGCNFCNVFCLGNKQDTSYDIEIRAHTPDSRDSWRVAVLSYNWKADNNVISQELLNVLGTPVQHFDEHTTKPKKGRKQRHDVDGYVDLEWCFEHTKTIIKSRFYVTSVHDPPYDAVLGGADAKRIGKIKTKYR